MKVHSQEFKPCKHVKAVEIINNSMNIFAQSHMFLYLINQCHSIMKSHLIKLFYQCTCNYQNQSVRILIDNEQRSMFARM